jgi:hypothetical protein
MNLKTFAKGSEHPFLALVPTNRFLFFGVGVHGQVGREGKKVNNNSP